MVQNMQWWNEIIEWFNSPAGVRIVYGAIIPAAAILVAGVVAALIGRASTRRLLAFQNRQVQSSAVAALITAGERAATWSTLSAAEKDLVAHQLNEATTRVRLLGAPGASVAADWAAHQLNEMKRNSAGFAYQSEQTLVEFRDGLVEWHNRPKRARKLFAQNLAAWKYDTNGADPDLVAKQEQWAREQAAVAPATDVTDVFATPTK